MKERIYKAVALCMVPALLLCTGCDFGNNNGYQQVYILDDSEDLSSAVAWEMYEDTDQMTEDDIDNMSNGDYTIVYRDDGYVSSLIGRFYDQPVKDENEVLTALVGVYDLLGIDESTEYNFSAYLIDHGTDYEYYTYQQLAGEESIENCTLVIVTDQDDYVCGVSNSFAPSGTYSATTMTIDARQAEQVVANYYPNSYIYSDYTNQVTFSINNKLYEAFAVYTDNPQQDSSFDMPFLEHFVAYDGDYLWSSPTNNMASGDDDIYRNYEYFEQMTETTYAATITRADGVTVDVEVPVCYNSNDGLYYLMDPTRYIACADFYEFCYNDEALFLTSTNNEDWDSNYVLAYYNYIKVWDFFDYVGVQSIDRNKLPLLIGMGYCDQNHNGVDNAGYIGVYSGWGFFGVSAINTASQALDVVAHEYMHGYTSHAMQGDIYANEPGAINESISDIMGNLIEYWLDETYDTEWLVGETGNYTCRSMSNPIEYKQPEYVGDAYYVPATDNPNVYYNDYGGVHSNSSFLNLTAYRLHERGMDLATEIIMWLTVVEFLTPQSDFDDVYVALLLSAGAHEDAQEYVDDITEIYGDLGLLGDRTDAIANAPLRNGYFSVIFNVSNMNPNTLCSVILYDQSGNYYNQYTPDRNGNITIQAEAGTYMFVYDIATNVDGTNYDMYYYTGSTWSSNQRDLQSFTFQPGDTYGPITIN